MAQYAVTSVQEDIVSRSHHHENIRMGLTFFYNDSTLRNVSALNGVHMCDWGARRGSRCGVKHPKGTSLFVSVFRCWVSIITKKLLLPCYFEVQSWK